ncbi:unnamed protein product [Camellia sinensis]
MLSLSLSLTIAHNVFFVSLFALCLFLFLFDIHINTYPRPPFKITTTKNVSHHGRVALFPHCEVGGEPAKAESKHEEGTNTKRNRSSSRATMGLAERGRMFGGSVWSRLHSTITNPLNLKPLASDKRSLSLSLYIYIYIVCVCVCARLRVWSILTKYIYSVCLSVWPLLTRY